jgi:hypothetical protein
VFTARYGMNTYVTQIRFALVGRDSSVRIGTGYGLDGPRIESRL